jgi:type III secretory pathway component EscR
MRINIIDNKDLGVLQNTLIDYFKDRTLSTKNLLRQESLLKKIENTFKKHLIKHIAKVLKLQRYFKKSLHKYYKKHVYS